MGNSESQDLQKLNILLIGKAGVGKSTLINSVFGQELAPEGIGSPFTNDITQYTTEDSNLTLYDTPGIDPNRLLINTFIKTIQNKINELSKLKDINKCIHCIWYCVGSKSETIAEYEKQIIAAFKNIPVIIVLTKYCNTFEESEMMRKIEIQKLNIKYIVPVLARNIENERAFGIDILAYFTINSLPSNINASWENFKPIPSDRYQYIQTNINPDNLLENNDSDNNDININQINVLVVGKTGVGKSTLINNFLNIEAAIEGIGRPVTQDIHEFNNDDSIFHLFDTPGFEHDETQQVNTLRNINTLIRDRSRNTDENMYIHCIWYCIRCGSARIDEQEIAYINNLSNSVRNNRIPVFILLTQANNDDLTKRMIESIQEININIERILPVLARDFYLEDFEPPKRCPRYGLEDLKNFTYYQITNHYFISNNNIQFNNIHETINTLRKINVIVIGKQNAGRKTLINKILDEDRANSNDDSSEEIIQYESERSNYNFYKTPYFDENPVKKVKLRENIINLVRDKLLLNDFSQAIHCIWYCVKCAQNELQESDISFIKILSEILSKYRINIILVLTQCYDNNVKDSIINQIENEHEIIKYHQTIVAENHIDDTGAPITTESFGIDELQALTNEVLNNSFIFGNLDENVRNNFNDTIQKLTKINILTIGKSGIGKSTLINNFFSGHLAATGVGVPVTKRITPLTTPNSLLTIYDTPGFENNPGQQKEMQKDIKKLIKKGYDTRDINKYIHCIWYCIDSGSGRFEESEKQFIQDLTKDTSIYQIPIFIILTQSYIKENAERLKQTIINEHLKVVDIIPIVAEDKLNGNSICKAYGLDILTERMGDSLPEALKISFNNVQIASLSYKRKCSYATVATSVASSAIVGGSPIPFTDIFFIAGIEISMLSAITVIYNLEISNSIKSSIITICFGCSITSLVGKTLISNILKIIPVAGQIVGGVVSGVTSAVLTSALGSSYIILMEAISKGEIDPKNLTKQELKKFIKPIFHREIENEREKLRLNNNNNNNNNNNDNQ